MKANLKSIIFVFGILIFVLQGCTHDNLEPIAPPVDNADQLAFDNASAVVGSQLYNDFTLTPGFDAPADASVNIADITGFKDFYRCKQCHAWDQKARFGSYIKRAPKVKRPDVSDVQLTNLKFADIRLLFDKIKNTGGPAVSSTRTSDGTNPSLGGNSHADYGKILTDAQIWDLVKFLKAGAFDVDELYSTNTTGSYPTGTVSFSDIGRDGDAAAGMAFFNSKCATCHGADGKTIDLGGLSVGDFARSKPYEIQHKVVSGQLGSNMGPTAITLQEMKNLLKALIELPPLVDPIDPNLTAFENANVVRGFQLYNDFTLTPGFTGPNDPTVNIADITDFKDFYRCKQCHAWDRKARFASYVNRAPKVTRPDVSDVQLTGASSMDILVLFDKIKNTGGAAVDRTRTSDGTNPALGGNNHPDYGKILTDGQIWDLVKFLKEGGIDTDQLYTVNVTGTYPTGSRTFTDLGKDGDATMGDTFFTSKCATCHGADGTTIALGGSTLGKFLRSNPHEVQHKIISGQLGSSMGPTAATLADLKNLYKAFNNTAKYPN
ncbi:MAG: hypothetical protein CO119_08750 [Flavobacteriales bacterium CG_4_9_14_3_um_filter_40_17]|nr:MAG: hypothetical protein CO119_08750 [Flavobacteriales bacterium CG_4_9_14_3_um_filter_40_17]